MKKKILDSEDWRDKEEIDAYFTEPAPEEKPMKEPPKPFSDDQQHQEGKSELEPSKSPQVSSTLNNAESGSVHIQKNKIVIINDFGSEILSQSQFNSELTSKFKSSSLPPQSSDGIFKQM